MTGIQRTPSRISDLGNGMRMKCNLVAHDDDDVDDDDDAGTGRDHSHSPIVLLILVVPMARES